MSSVRVGRYVAWVILAIILVAGWLAFELAQRQLVRIREARAEAGGSPRAPSGPMRSVGPFASESGAVGTGNSPGAGETGSVPRRGDEGVEESADGGQAAPKSETDAGKSLPPGAIW